MGLDVAGSYRYPAPRAEWLARQEEGVLLPDQSIVDAHHHLWMQDGNRYLLDEFAADLQSGHRIEQTVFVQAHYGYRESGPEHLKPVGETERVAAMGAEAEAAGYPTRIAAGIVAFADLSLGADVESVIEAHHAAAGGRLRGIRHSVSRDSNFPSGIVLRPAQPHLLSSSQYRAGLDVVARHGLSYDAMLYHQQIPELTAMARALPHLTIVLDHMGCMIGVGPYRGHERETLRTWRRDIAELATCANVVVKLGGLGMIICGPTWNERPEPPSSLELAEAWRPQIEPCLELFGADRCMFESNFPVDKGMYSYRNGWNAFKRLATGASEAERDALFQGTARRIYRLSPQVENQAGAGAAKRTIPLSSTASNSPVLTR